MGDVNNEEFMVDGDDSGKELDVMGMMSEFLTIGESMNKAIENVSVVVTKSDENLSHNMSNKSTDMELQNTESYDKTNEVTCNVNVTNQNVINTCNHDSTSVMKTNGFKINSSYAKVVGNGSELSKELLYIPSEINENRDEVVIFEEKMRRYGRHGLAEIIANNSDISFFKFKSVEGMNYVTEQIPWMVNGRPFVVQKWDLDVCTEKAYPPSRLGKPIMMDNMTASMCHKGTGGAGYARILVEVVAKKVRLPSAKKATTLLLCMMMGIDVDEIKVVGNPYLDSGCQG
uniref:DUF4283 domain-containing protein n=1 Tax=Tanacetum cinerariifolium TaxID=118510 RepID=A0A6L2M6G3_TANCI|nr:hypothetical protein [Tanacetum cinerariifolium]